MADAASGRLPDPLAAFSFPGRDQDGDKPYIEGGAGPGRVAPAQPLRLS